MAYSKNLFRLARFRCSLYSLNKCQFHLGRLSQLFPADKPTTNNKPQKAPMKHKHFIEAFAFSLFSHPGMIGFSIFISPPAPRGNGSPPETAQFFFMKSGHVWGSFICFQYRLEWCQLLFQLFQYFHWEFLLFWLLPASAELVLRF